MPQAQTSQAPAERVFARVPEPRPGKGWVPQPELLLDCCSPHAAVLMLILGFLFPFAFLSPQFKSLLPC